MKNKLYCYIGLISLVFNSLIYAENKDAPKHSAWHTVIGLGGGVEITNNLGNSQTFPILNPITDEYYLYSVTNSSQAAGVFEVFLGMEGAIFNNWLLQGGLAYNQSGTYRAQGSFVQGADSGSDNQYKVTARELVAEAKLMPYHDKFYPYFLAGIGGAFNLAYSYGTNVPEFLTFTRQYNNNISGSLAYKLGLGLDVDIAQHTRIGLSYRFDGLGHVGLGAAKIDNIGVSGALYQSNLYANSILAQLTYLI